MTVTLDSRAQVAGHLLGSLLLEEDSALRIAPRLSCSEVDRLVRVLCLLERPAAAYELLRAHVVGTSTMRHQDPEHWSLMDDCGTPLDAAVRARVQRLSPGCVGCGAPVESACECWCPLALQHRGHDHEASGRCLG